MPWDEEKELNVDEFDTEQEEVEFADLAAVEEYVDDLDEDLIEVEKLVKRKELSTEDIDEDEETTEEEETEEEE